MRKENTEASPRKPKEFFLDFAQIGTKEELHAYLKEQLALPDHYGNNLDALYDCLTEFPFCIITLIHPDALAKLELYALSLMEVFEAAAQSNPRILLYVPTEDECTHDCGSCRIGCGALESLET